MSNDEAYMVIEQDAACHKCGSGQRWTVRGPDGFTIGEAWADASQAEDVADLMNEAYHKGVKWGLKQPREEK